jgi:outer membrane protein OmpA-like peptidoglycan-associated protein
VKPFVIAVVLCLLPGLGRAQVVVNQAALDQLAGIVPAAPVVRAPVPPRHVHKRLVVRPVLKLAVVPPPPKPLALVKPPPKPPAKPAPPLDPQAQAALDAAREAQAVAQEDAKFAQAASAPVVPTALPKPAPALKPVPGMAAIVLDFAPGGADLPATAASSLQPVCKRAGPEGIVAIDAYAPADPGDPSAAMRLSLNRAFAVRDALTACGVAAAHIIPRADGAAGGDTGIARVSLSGGLEKQ